MIDDSKMEIEIDGKKILVDPTESIIQVADREKIKIPRFCYHSKLPIAANCRMCLVEVSNCPKPMPACCTPVAPNLKVYTQSEKTKKAQKGVLEFLLANHPLDCPICDQGGECELQDLTMKYGNSCSRFKEEKRVVIDKNLGPLISTDLTRCIHCTRCVRFGEEISGIREIGATGRGEDMEIGTFIEKNIDSELSANIIDLCPVGALTSKPFRFRARSWEMQAKKSIAAHDCVGSNIWVNTKNNKVFRILPRENEDINSIWLSDRDRFSYTAIENNRLLIPKIKIDNQWQDASWEQAINLISDKIKNNSSIGAFASHSSSCEEFYVLQRLIRQIGSDNIDYRLRQVDFDELSINKKMTVEIKDLKNQEFILLIGSDLCKEQPILSINLREMNKNSGKISVINPMDFKVNFELDEKIIVNHSLIYNVLLDIAESIKNKNISDQNTIVNNLVTLENKVIILGALAIHNINYSKIKYLVEFIAYKTGTKVLFLPEGANALGAEIANFIPNNKNKSNTNSILDNKLENYVLMGIELEDFCMHEKAKEAFRQAKFVVSLTAFESASLLEYADVLLPINIWLENDGTFINCEGKWQSFSKTVNNIQNDSQNISKSAWEVIKLISMQLGLPFSDSYISETLESIKKLHAKKNIELNTKTEFDLNIIKNIPNNHSHKSQESSVSKLVISSMYATDMILRRAKPLNNTNTALQERVNNLDHVEYQGIMRNNS